MKTVAATRSRYTPARVLAGIATRVREVVSGLGAIVPRMVFGNNAGVRNNLAPRRDLERLRRAFAASRNALPGKPHPALARQLHEQGFLVSASSVERRVIDGIRADVSRLIADPEVAVPSPNGATTFIFEPLRAIPDIRQLLTPALCRTIFAYYGCAMQIQSVRIWRNHHVPGIDADRDDRFSNTFHHDNYAVTGLRVFVLLSDGVTRETGALRFHDRVTSARIARSPGFFHRARLTPKIRARLVDPTTLKYFEGNSGDSCIANTQQCLHAASVPRAGSHRDMLQFEVYPAAGPCAEEGSLFEGLPPDAEVLAMRRVRN